MKYILITLFQIFIYLVSSAQSPTYRALLELNHSVDNNLFDLKGENITHTENLLSTNVFFKYYKNPNIKNAGPDDSMIFSVGYQYLILLKVDKNLNNELSFPLYSNKDSKGRLKIYSIDPKTNKESKMKGKYYHIKDDNGVLKLTIDKTALPLNHILKVFLEIESFYFKELILTPQIIEDISKRICSSNIPALFKYHIQSNSSLEIADKSEEFMKLKQFTYQTPPIEDYNVDSYSTEWILTDSTNLKLVLDSINLPVDVGTSVEQIMKYSN